MSRLISERILQSDKMESLSPEGFEFYIRWYTITDRSGVAPADPAFLRTKLYPKRPRLNTPTTKAWRDAVIASGLVTLYKNKAGEELARFYRFRDFNGKLTKGILYDADEGWSHQPMTGEVIGNEGGSHGGVNGVVIPQKPPVSSEKLVPDVDVKKMKSNDEQSVQSNPESKPTLEPEVECSKCGYTPCCKKWKCDPKEAVPAQSKPAPVKKQPAAAKQQVADPLRGWSKDVGEVLAERIRLCVRFKLDLEPEDWYLTRISTKSLGNPGFVNKLNSECPDSAVIQKLIKSKIKTKAVWDENCPHGCNKGKLQFRQPGSLFFTAKHCECLREVEVA